MGTITTLVVICAKVGEAVGSNSVILAFSSWTVFLSQHRNLMEAVFE